MHFCYDIETLGTNTNSIVPALSIVYFDLEEQVSYQDLLDRTLFVKFDIADQKYNYGRTIEKSTMDWWKSQKDSVISTILKPSNKDVSLETGLDQLNTYINTYKQNGSMVWTRGELDQLITNSLYKYADMKHPIHYNKYMCIRTFMRLMKESTNNIGYATIPNFDKSQVEKHHPSHDVCYDVYQILYGE